MVSSDVFFWKWIRVWWIDCDGFYEMNEVEEMVGGYDFMEWMR